MNTEVDCSYFAQSSPVDVPYRLKSQLLRKLARRRPTRKNGRHYIIEGQTGPSR